jgi:tape measure domain-containing protein
MATIGSLAVNIVANTQGLSRGLGNARKEVSGFAASLGSLGGGVVTLGAAAVAAGASFAAWGVKLASSSEQAEVALGTMLGSADKAKAMMAEIGQFAASTPFEKMQLVEASRGLLAFGVGADDVMGHLKTLGDIASGSGSQLTDMVQIFGKVQATGRATMEEVNRLAERGIPIYKVLGEQLGMTGDELRDFISEGGLTADVFNQSLQPMTEQGGIFFNSMENQSQTLSGLWSTLKDNVAQLAEGLGQLLLPVIKGLVKFTSMLVEGLNRLLGVTEKVTPKMQTQAKAAQAIVATDKEAAKAAERAAKAREKLGIRQQTRDQIAALEAQKIGRVERREPQLIGALLRGSQDAIRAIELTRQQRIARKVEEDQLREQKKTNDRLDKMIQALKDSQTLELAEI